MTVVVYLIVAVAAVAWLAQAVCVGFFLKMLSIWRKRSPHHGPLPKATVLLSLRGADPGLADNLRALLRQDYPDYDVRAVVDGREDAAWAVLEMLQYEPGGERLQFEELAFAQPYCSLKNSALIQLCHNLDESIEVVAFMDGDVRPHADWLRNLAIPLQNEEIGLTTGLRWYRSQDSEFGSLMRYLWAAGALVQCWMNGIVWAGSMAMRRTFMEEVDIPGMWSRSLSTDGPLFAVVKRAGRRGQFVPEALMLNVEQIGARDSLWWMSRQMLIARLYHSGFKNVIVHAASMAALAVAFLATLGYAVAAGDTTAAVWLYSAGAVYLVGCAVLTAILDVAAQRVVRAQGTRIERLRFDFWLWAPLGVAAMHFVMPVATTIASFTNRVRWREAEYLIESPWEIRLMAYRPYRQLETAGTQSIV